MLLSRFLRLIISSLVVDGDLFLCIFFLIRAQGDAAMEAIKHALRALRKRHLVEEGAHSPAIIALSRPIVSQVG